MFSFHGISRVTLNLFLVCEPPTSKLKALLHVNLDFVKRLGLAVKAIVGYQAAIDVKLCIALMKSAKHPFFYFKEEGIHILYGYYHLIEYVGNTFLSSDNASGNDPIRFDVMKSVYGPKNDNVNFKLYAKLTMPNIYSNATETMRVLRAV